MQCTGTSLLEITFCTLVRVFVLNLIAVALGDLFQIRVLHVSLVCPAKLSLSLSLSLSLFLSFRYLKRPTMSGPGLYDPTEVMNRAQMSLYTKEGFIKVGFYVLSFLVYLYK